MFPRLDRRPVSLLDAQPVHPDEDLLDGAVIPALGGVQWGPDVEVDGRALLLLLLAVTGGRG